MDREQVREVVKEAVQETLVSLGFDTTNPREMQKDLAWVREVRTSSAGLRAKITAALLLTIATAALAATWVGLKKFLQSE